ncbi:MAG: DUF484 family protein [Hyphomicrobiales bacterium]|nr:DUF484 family protein [Hyphomicrobiales bacterium]
MTQTHEEQDLEDGPEDGDEMDEVSVTEDQVTDFLYANPDFLARNPDLLESMDWPERWRGDGVVDMQKFMVERLRGEIDNLRDATQDVIETSRTNMSVQQRTHAAVLALLAAEGLDPLFHLVTEELPLVLGVDAMTIGFEPAFPPMTRLIAPDVHSLTPGTVDRLLGEGGDISLRKDMADDGTVFGPAADLVRSAALVRIQPGGEAPVGLFAIGAREPDVFQPRQGTELVAFLARVVERCVERWLATPE